jgi:hypothetical protein
MRQKTKNYRIKGSNAKKCFIFFYFPSHIPKWVWFVQKTRAKNSHAWAPLNEAQFWKIFQTSLKILLLKKLKRKPLDGGEAKLSACLNAVLFLGFESWVVTLRGGVQSWALS